MVVIFNAPDAYWKGHKNDRKKLHLTINYFKNHTNEIKRRYLTTEKINSIIFSKDTNLKCICLLECRNHFLLKSFLGQIHFPNWKWYFLKLNKNMNSETCVNQTSYLVPSFMTFYE